MTILRLSFAGTVKKADHKTIGDKPAVSLSIYKKNRGKTEPATFTWINVTVFQPPEFMAGKLVAGAFVAGSGEFQLRSYEKDNVKRQSADVTCNSFDIDMAMEPASGAIAHHAGKPYDSQAKRANDPMDSVAGNLPAKTQPEFIGDEPPF